MTGARASAPSQLGSWSLSAPNVVAAVTGESHALTVVGGYSYVHVARREIPQGFYVTSCMGEVSLVAYV